MSESQFESTILACPDCGGVSFSWIVSHVQFGTVQRVNTGQYSEVGKKMGPITGSDVDENGVFCTTCNEHRNRDELVPTDEAPTSDQAGA